MKAALQMLLGLAVYAGMTVSTANAQAPARRPRFRTARATSSSIWR